MDSPNSWHRTMAGATRESPWLYTLPAMVPPPLSMLNRSTKPLAPSRPYTRWDPPRIRRRLPHFMYEA